MATSIKLAGTSKAEKNNGLTKKLETLAKNNDKLIILNKLLDTRLKNIGKQILTLKNPSKVTTQSVSQANDILEAKLMRLNKQQILLKSFKKEKLRGDFGDLRINLKWETFDDLDLHVIDPCGNRIHYSLKEIDCNGSIGRLDVDPNYVTDHRKDPQENIYWESDPPVGLYKIIVVHF